MKLLSNHNSKNQFSIIPHESYLDNFRYVGKIVATVLSQLENLVKTRSIKSLIEMDKLAEELFIKNNCHPVFKGYHGFPFTVCISVNFELVHGIPKDYCLKEGDIVSFDTGAEFEGATADSAITCIFGAAQNNEAAKLVEATKCALYAGIEAAKTGSRIGSIGSAIFKTSKKLGYKVIEQYGGHGISQKLKNNRISGVVHAEPFVANKASKDDGIRIQDGMILAIEPLLIPERSSTKTIVDKDGWTVRCEDICSHWEHSIYISKSGTEILTKREDENII